METKHVKKDGEHVWNAFTQMKSYMEKSYLLLDQATPENYFVTANRRQVYDGVSTLLNSNLGHKHPRIQQAILEQLQRLDTASMFVSTNTAALNYAKQLLKATEDRYYSIFYTNSGSEACDTAIKIARKYWKNRGENRPGIISLEGSYHGSSIGAMMVAYGGYAMDDYALKHDYFYQIPVPDPLLHPEFGDETALVQHCLNVAQTLMRDDQACVGALIIEQVQLSNAAFALPQEFVIGLEKLCRANGVLLIVDEVATGFGRTGSLFGSEQIGVWGDLMMFAKGVTSGYIPMGGVLSTKDVFMTFWADNPESALEHGFTTGGHPVACAAASACLELLQTEQICAIAAQTGAYLREQLQALKAFSFVREVRGKGLMLALILDETIKIPGMEQWGVANIVSRFLVNKGILLYPDSDSTIIIAPALNAGKSECDMICAALRDCLEKIALLTER